MKDETQKNTKKTAAKRTTRTSSKKTSRPRSKAKTASASAGDKDQSAAVKKSPKKTASKKAAPQKAASKKSAPARKPARKEVVAPEESVAKFAALGLEGKALKALRKMGWSEPSEIQAGLIPLALQGHDVLGQARTGTGKTASFALPILQLLDQNPPAGRSSQDSDGESRESRESGKPGKKGRKGERSDTHGASPVRCLVLAPTRELAAQVAKEMGRMGSEMDQRITMAYGGTKMRTQVMELKRHPSIVVGTPGRVMDLMERKLLHLDTLEFAVLDEVDRMLDIGFRDDIRRILSRATGKHQTIFVSATIDDPIKRLAMRYMNDPKEIFLAPDKKTVDEVDQFYLSVQPADKKKLLAELLRREKPSLAIVFTRTKRDTTKVARYLNDNGIEARDIHGDLMQNKRERIMKRFRDGQINVLVATDLASRGIDVDNVSHIVNYDIPEDPEAYVHRVGRTARMGSRGRAFVFVTPEQGGLLTNIEIFINREVPQKILENFKLTETARRATTSTADQDEKASSRPSTLPKRLEAPKEDPTATANKPRRTLGSKFPSRRRRR